MLASVFYYLALIIFYHIPLTGTTITTFSFFSCDLLEFDLYYDRQTKSQEARAMGFAKTRNLLLQLQETDYRNFVKALISIETNCTDEEKLDNMYEKFMEDDTVNLLNASITEKN